MYSLETSLMTKMTYQETLQYLFEQLPMYQRIGKAAYKADLGNALKLDQYFGHPHKKYKTIHVAGTNGKGSVSHLLSSVLQSAGYKTGLYTSPHLVDFRERIRVNGEMISEEEVVKFVDEHFGVLEKIKPSFFEMTMSLAFYYFENSKVDVAVVEVGLGGRLDSTNIITPDLSIITNIGLDHTMFLGNSLEAIAAEKAGIIKKDVPVIIGRFQPETAGVFRQKAFQEHAPLIFAKDKFAVESYSETADWQLLKIKSDSISREFKLPLKGIYQQENLITTLAAVEELRYCGYEISDEATFAGIANVVKQTGLKGRWQKISDSPEIICDTGHNADGIERIVQQFKQSGYRTIHIIWGMVNDKDSKAILKMLPVEARYYFTRASIPRALDEKDLQQKAREVGLEGDTFKNVGEALKCAKKNASDNDLIFIGGSTFVVAEAIEK